jgi:hypothetical protein
MNSKLVISFLLIQLSLVKLIAGECSSTTHCPLLHSLASVGNCDFYKEVENVRNCSSSGYPISYGFKYCVKFGDKYESFNKDGQVWIDSVRKCLMSNLVTEFDSLTDCTQLKNYAFTTHVECYLRPGFGAKSICDIWASKNLVGLLQTYDLLDFFKDKVALFQVFFFYIIFVFFINRCLIDRHFKVFATGTDCIKQYGSAIGSTIVQMFANLASALTGGIIG